MSALQKSSSASSGWLLPDKLRSRIMAFTFPAAFILGTYGYRHYAFGEEPVSLTNAMYHAAQLFIMHAPHFGAPVPWTLEIARWMAAASTLLVLLNASLYLFQNERMDLKLKRRKKHAIVCGLGRRGIAVAEKLHATGTRVVAVDKYPEPDIEERLHTLGIPLITGDAARKEILHQARIEYADSLFVLCPEDTTNFSIAMVAHNMNCKTVRPRQCFIHINDAELRNALQTNYLENQAGTNQTLRFIDAYGPEAISLLVHGLPLDHDGIAPGDTRQVHLVILGFGSMGRSIAVKASQIGQFANRKSLRISVIDRHADVNQAALLFHHPFIGDVADFSFYEQEVLSPETRSQIEKWCNEPEMLVSVAICFDNPSIAYDTVFNLLPVFNRKNVRVAVRVQEPENFEFLLKGAGAGNYQDLRIHPFGIEKSFENLTDPGKNVTEKFAVDIHKAYIMLTLKQNKDKAEKLDQIRSSGVLNEWNDLKEDFRESNRQQAVHIFFKLRASGLEMVDITDPHPAIEVFEKGLFEALAMMEHVRWVAERKVNNWKYGKPSDKANRINENIIEWDQLTENIKQYDYEAISQIPQLLQAMGKKMVAKRSV